MWAGVMMLPYWRHHLVNPDEATVFPQTMNVDFVKVYQRQSE